MFFWKNKKQVGIDLVDVSRFKVFENDKNHPFLKKSFSEYELTYCFSYKDPAPHLSGIFAAKEAVSKALGVKKFPFIGVEIKHATDGKPEVYYAGKKLNMSVSISHTGAYAVAVAIT